MMNDTSRNSCCSAKQRLGSTSCSTFPFSPEPTYSTIAPSPGMCHLEFSPVSSMSDLSMAAEGEVEISDIEDIEPQTPTRIVPTNLSSAFDSPPTTPRVSTASRMWSPPPAPRRMPEPALMKALEADDERLLAQCLAEDADAARSVFFDHDFEPPLCYAARMLCKVSMIQLLLENGADVTAVDVHSRTPLAALSATPTKAQTLSMMGPCFMNFPWSLAEEKERRSIEIAKLLIGSGADAVSDGNGQSCVELAREHGNTHLVHVYEACINNGDQVSHINNWENPH